MIWPEAKTQSWLTAQRCTTVGFKMSVCFFLIVRGSVTNQPCAFFHFLLLPGCGLGWLFQIYSFSLLSGFELCYVSDEPADPPPLSSPLPHFLFFNVFCVYVWVWGDCQAGSAIGLSSSQAKYGKWSRGWWWGGIEVLFAINNSQPSRTKRHFPAVDHLTKRHTSLSHSLIERSWK